MANKSSYSCHRTPLTLSKGKKYMTSEDEPPLPSGRVSNMLQGKSRGQLLIAPERMEQLGQSRNSTQLWICLMVKIKSRVAKKKKKNNIV